MRIHHAGRPTWLVAAAMAASAAHAAPSPGTKGGSWILTCDMPSSPGASPAGAASPRVFRVAPQLFQEWRPDMRSWGYNLCSSFRCSADPERLEAVITSASLILTIRLDRRSGAGSWATQGASGLTRTSGACTVEPEATAKRPS